MNGSRKYNASLMTLGVLTVVAMLLAGWAFHDRFAATNQNRAETKATWHAVVCGIEQSVLHRKPPLSARRLNEFLDFYDNLLVNQVHTAACGIPRR